MVTRHCTTGCCVVVFSFQGKIKINEKTERRKERKEKKGRREKLSKRERERSEKEGRRVDRVEVLGG